MARSSQRWIIDAFIGQAGLDVLHPEATGIFLKFGYEYSDLKRAFDRIKAAGMATKAWSSVASEVESRGVQLQELGYPGAARALLKRAALMYGRAAYTILADAPSKRAFHDKMRLLYQEVNAAGDNPPERVEIPFEGKTVYAWFHHAQVDGPRPCVVMIPGMDMMKEEWHEIIREVITPRGWHAIAMDGPGQGESLLHGLTVTLDNYERAVSAVVDTLVERDAVDSSAICALGISMGSYWGTRAAATESRLAAVATGLGCYGLNDQQVIFNMAQPKFKANFMYMSGIGDEEEFDRTMTQRMALGDLAPQIQMPFLMAIGEFDELMTVADGLAVYDKVPPPKEWWLFEDEFHPLGNVSKELFWLMADWLENCLAGRVEPDRDRRIRVSSREAVMEGTGKPSWWVEK